MYNIQNSINEGNETESEDSGCDVIHNIVSGSDRHNAVTTSAENSLDLVILSGPLFQKDYNDSYHKSRSGVTIVIYDRLPEHKGWVQAFKFYQRYLDLLHPFSELLSK